MAWKLIVRPPNRQCVCLSYAKGSEDKGNAQGCSLIIAKCVWNKIVRSIRSGKIAFNEWVVFKGMRFSVTQEWRVLVCRHKVCITDGPYGDESQYLCSATISRKEFEKIISEKPKEA